MDTPLGREEVLSYLEETEEPIIVVSLPCTPWAKYQPLNLSKGSEETRKGSC